MWTACVGPPALDAAGDAALHLPLDPHGGQHQANAWSRTSPSATVESASCSDCVRPVWGQPSGGAATRLATHLTKHLLCPRGSISWIEAGECYKLSGAASPATARLNQRCSLTVNGSFAAMRGSGGGSHMLQDSMLLDVACGESQSGSCWLPIARAPGGTVWDWEWLLTDAQGRRATSS